MKTDPNKGCANQEQRLFWALVHDGVAHPFMALTNYSRLSLRFHDFTSHKAWPRTPPMEIENAYNLLIHNGNSKGVPQELIEDLRQLLRQNKVPCFTEGAPTDTGYEYCIHVWRPKPRGGEHA